MLSKYEKLLEDCNNFSNSLMLNCCMGDDVVELVFSRFSGLKLGLLQDPDGSGLEEWFG